MADEDGSELARVSDVDGFFVPRAPEAQVWRTFDLLGCSPLELGTVGNIDLCVLDDTGRTMGAYYIALTTVDDVRPSAVADGLVDVSMTGLLLSQPHPMAAPVWARWPPREPNLWAPYDEAGRAGWLEVARMYRPRRRDDRPAGTTVVVDGRFATDVAGMYLAIGEAVNGPGGYFGASPDALADCLCGGFGATVPFTMKWTSVDVVSEMGALLLDSAKSHWDEVRDVLTRRGVTLEGLR